MCSISCSFLKLSTFSQKLQLSESLVYSNPMNTILWWMSYCIYIAYSLLKISASTDTITASQSLKDGETIVSSGGSFELGFFSPGNSGNRYLGIWYKNIPVQTVVWVANRDTPITDSSGLLSINITAGLVVLSNRTDLVIWSSANLNHIAQNPFLQLLDSGNLVLSGRNGNSDFYMLWQSFDYPTDTLLPGMKFGWDLRTNLNRRLSAWRSPDDPSPGELISTIELDDYPQKVYFRGTRKYIRIGPWNGLRFTGTPELKPNPMFDFKFIFNRDEVYYTYQLLNESVITRLILNQTTLSSQRYVWADNSWRIYASVPHDYCDNYGLCGANGLCVITGSPVCQCLKGFKPNSTQRWNAMDWSDGCIRNEPLDCTRKHDFVKFSGLKLPDTTYSWLNQSLNMKECKRACLKNCSCMAYTNSDISGRGSGCALWFGDLVDVRQFSDGGQDLYIRMPSSQRAKRSMVVVVALIVAPISVFCGMLLFICYLFRRKMRMKGENEVRIEDVVQQREDLDLPVLDLSTVALATEKFSVNNKLGEGGFGPVYKGLLVCGNKIAVKRLSKSSGQGQDEFKNEARLIAKLQHRNLVKLLGCCIEGDEKILIYEYMHNGSLDSFLFDQTRGSLLDWPKRYNIICGVARGLLYLHQDSRLRIIHRDLKASNVLLDDDLNPKISDFGMARSFGGDQSQDKTRRIVGTYGYMAPEYAVYGLFSVKSDVFSFGILLLEILSGKKNRGSDHPENLQNLIGYAWKLWNEDKPLELMYSSLDEPVVQCEMVRCIHVSLLCIQQNPEDRPTMSRVVLMLNGETMLPEPKQPGFLLDLVPSKTFSLSSSNDSCSVNDITITTTEGR